MATCIRALFVFFVIFATIQYGTAANIVILLLPTFSHIVGPANVAKVLQDQGHNVTITIPPQMRTKLEGKGVNVLVYNGLGDFEAQEKLILENILKGNIDILKVIPDKMLRDEQLLKDIQAHQPDLIILDSTPPARMLTIIPYKLNIPFMFIGSACQLQYARNPLLPSVIPNGPFGFTDQMTFTQRLSNTIIGYLMYIYDPFTISTALRDYAPGKPYISMQDLQAKALLWIVSLHGVLDYNPPIMPNVKSVGHLVPFQPNPLTAEFQDFMDNAKDGVVIVSFGSILKYLPLEVLNKLLAAFKQTKYKFVIRHSMTDSENSEQFLFSNWLPQNDILHHKNTRLFITHCGVGGLHEAVSAGVPMIGLPVIGDQPHNADLIVRKGYGLRFDLKTFLVKDLVSAIEEVITNPEYKSRVMKASVIMRADRVPPVEQAAFWINHILTFGADHLRSSGQDIPLWKYLGLDVLAFCLLVLHIVLFVFVKLLSFCFRRCCQKTIKLKNQ